MSREWVILTAGGIAAGLVMGVLGEDEPTALITLGIGVMTGLRSERARMLSLIESVRKMTP